MVWRESRDRNDHLETGLDRGEVGLTLGVDDGGRLVHGGDIDTKKDGERRRFVKVSGDSY